MYVIINTRATVKVEILSLYYEDFIFTTIVLVTPIVLWKLIINLLAAQSFTLQAPEGNYTP
jgi:hypothetical protein